MKTEFGMQELYFVTIKSTSIIEINGTQIAENEIIAAFDKIQLANFKEIYKEIAAQGGYQNRKLAIWNRTEGVDLVFTQGIFSKTQFGLMQNSKFITIKDNELIKITQRDELETNEEGKITLSQKPINSRIFVYNKKTGEKLLNLIMTGEKEILTPLIFKDVIVDYEYAYNNGASVGLVGEDIFDGYVSLEGRSRIVDDITGETHTVIIIIPKLKITSDFNLTLGEKMPVVGQFRGTALPIGQSKSSHVLEIYFLEDDIDKNSEWR